jgi:hypothetical protein
MNQEFLSSLHKVTPITDKLLALAGTSMAAFLTLGHVQTMVGITVGILTGLAIIPRIVIGYIDMRRKIRHADDDEEVGGSEE